MAKKRVFISFDYDHDQDIKGCLVSQAKQKDSPFSFVDESVKEPIDQKWKQKVRSIIKSCDIVIILCGRHTDSATGVSAELSIAQEERIPYILLSGHHSESVPPKGAKSTDIMHKWSWKKIHELFYDSE